MRGLGEQKSKITIFCAILAYHYKASDPVILGTSSPPCETEQSWWILMQVALKSSHFCPFHPNTGFPHLVSVNWHLLWPIQCTSHTVDKMTQKRTLKAHVELSL